VARGEEEEKKYQRGRGLRRLLGEEIDLGFQLLLLSNLFFSFFSFLLSHSLPQNFLICPQSMCFLSTLSQSLDFCSKPSPLSINYINVFKISLTLVYFHGRPAHTHSKWPIFKGDRPTHTYSKWSIFKGDLPTHTHSGLFSRATCPHSHWSIFTGDLPTHTHFGLFSRATDPFDWVYLRSHLAI
jgi:hypothetical protein